MTGVFRDSTNGFDIPLDNLAAVGGYGDGAISQWTSAMWARFDDPAIVKFVIVVNPGDVGDILDIEQGASPISSVPGWVRAFNRPRRAPTLYVNRGNWPAVVAALRASSLDPTAIDWWVATLDGTLNVYFGSPGNPVPAGLRVVAVQWKGEAQTGGHFDESMILDVSWLGTQPQEVTSLFHPTIAGRVDDVYLSTTGHVIHTISQIFAGPPSIEDWASPPAAKGVVPGSLAAGWSPDGQHFLVRVIGQDGTLYYRQENLQPNADGTPNVEHEWTQLTAPSPLPPANTSGSVATAPHQHSIPPGPAFTGQAMVGP